MPQLLSGIAFKYSATPTCFYLGTSLPIKLPATYLPLSRSCKDYSASCALVHASLPESQPIVATAMRNIASEQVSQRYVSENEVTQQRSMDGSGHLALENIRESLIRQEDSIIFNLIERAQYKLNSAAYDATRMPLPIEGFQGSLLDYILAETEVLHGKVRRYTVPGEHPFFPHLIPDIILPSLAVPKVLHPGGMNVSITPQIWKMYFDDLLPALVKPGDDFNYGSSTTMDVLCLQALSRRIHFGAFVAEAKFRESPKLYEPLIRAKDADGLLNLLTFEIVEARVVKRVELKAAAFAQDIDLDENPSGEVRYKIDPKLVSRLYADWIMPLTKQVQVEYLLRRLDLE